MRCFLVLTASFAATLATAPLHAQAGHAGHAAPARDTAKAAAAHEGHGKAAPAKAAAAHEAHGKATPAKAAAGGHEGHGASATGSMEHSSGWKELDAYHMVMMQVWHPAKEKGDMAPIRAKAGALAASADVVAAAAIPGACDTPANRGDVAKVQAESRALAALVASNASDTAVLAALRALHDRFETVNRGCVVK